MSDTGNHGENEKRALTVRVRKIVGQLNTIEQMITNDRECTEILTQLISSRKALKSLTEKLIQDHLHHCIDRASKDRGRRELSEFIKILERYVE